MGSAVVLSMDDRAAERTRQLSEHAEEEEGELVGPMSSETERGQKQSIRCVCVCFMARVCACRCVVWLYSSRGGQAGQGS